MEGLIGFDAPPVATEFKDKLRVIRHSDSLPDERTNQSNDNKRANDHFAG